jgi:small conductance mechanosensitive channel
MSSWSGLLREAVAELSVAELELFELNTAQAEAAEAAAAESETEGEAAEAEGDGAAAELTPEQEALVERISEIRDTRTAISDRFRLVMDAFEAKGGDPTETEEYRAYISDVGGVTVDTRNWRTALLTIREWVAAEDGGRRLARNLGTVVLATAIGFAAGWVVSLVVNFALRRTELSSKLMRRFLRIWIERLGALVGFLVGLSWIGTNMTPILAGLGAAGFILAFALQSTISNFASGMLILFLRPFDAGDDIEAGGTSGKVERVTLFSTHLTTPENRTVIVPNNKIWEDVITN